VIKTPSEDVLLFLQQIILVLKVLFKSNKIWKCCIFSPYHRMLPCLPQPSKGCLRHAGTVIANGGRRRASRLNTAADGEGTVQS